MQVVPIMQDSLVTRAALIIEQFLEWVDHDYVSIKVDDFLEPQFGANFPQPQLHEVIQVLEFDDLFASFFVNLSGLVGFLGPSKFLCHVERFLFLDLLDGVSSLELVGEVETWHDFHGDTNRFHQLDSFLRDFLAGQADQWVAMLRLLGMR
jgi:hypothetical protein